MRRIGLTGGIASGKTTVAQLFAALGVPIIDTDELAREVVQPGSVPLSRISARFGPQVIGPDGALDRAALRALVFADAAARLELEAITHPAILEAMRARAANASGAYVILAIPLLVEKQLAKEVDRVLVVQADEPRRLLRLQVRDGVSREVARAMLAAQASDAERLAAADDVIVNDGDLGRVRDQVEALHARYLALAQARA